MLGRTDVTHAQQQSQRQKQSMRKRPTRNAPRVGPTRIPRELRRACHLGDKSVVWHCMCLETPNRYHVSLRAMAMAMSAMSCLGIELNRSPLHSPTSRDNRSTRPALAAHIRRTATSLTLTHPSTVARSRFSNPSLLTSCPRPRVRLPLWTSTPRRLHVSTHGPASAPNHPPTCSRRQQRRRRWRRRRRCWPPHLLRGRIFSASSRARSSQAKRV